MPHTRIHWGDGYLKVMPCYPPELPEKLRYWHRRMETDEHYRRVVTGTYRDCFLPGFEIVDDKPIQVLTTFPGFMHRVRTLLDTLGWTYDIIDERIPFPEPDIKAALAGLREYQWECSWTAIQSGGGVIACPTGWGKTHILASLIRAYSHEQLCLRNTPIVVLTCPDKDLAKQNYNRMRELLPGRDIGLVTSAGHKFTDDIQVCTLDSLHHLKATDAGILIVDEVHQAATEDRTEVLSQFNRARRWGASATPSGRFDGADLLTEGLIGPVVYKRTYQEGVADRALVPIVVYWVAVPPPGMGLEAILGYHSRKGRYDHGVEKNISQIQLIADIMKRTPDELQTLCIMQHTAQMNALTSYLPGVEYVHAATDPKKLQSQRQYDLAAVTPKEREERYRQFRSGIIRKIMSTYIYKQGVDFPELTVMIQAGGGGSEIASGQIPGRGSRPNPKTGKDAAYLVDFWHPWDIDETVDKTTGRKSRTAGPIFRDDRARDRVYEKLGFQRHWIDRVTQLPFIPGAELPPGQMDLFPNQKGV